ncbi:MAG: 50S ribosomal protein L10 [Candidatus Limnocylindrus sp.]
MPTQKKRDTIDSLRTELSGSRGLILSSYRGLTVAEFAAIRGALRAQGITYRVVKNRLMRVAANELGNTTLPDLLKGPTAIAFGSGDEAVLAKTVLGALKEYPAVEVRGAVLGEAILNLSQLTALSKLPTREVLLAKVAGAFQAPVQKVAFLFAAPLQKVGYALGAYKSKREAEAA